MIMDPWMMLASTCDCTRQTANIYIYCGSARTELKMWCAIVVNRWFTTRVRGEQTVCTVCTVQNVWWKNSESGVKRAKWPAIRTQCVTKLFNTESSKASWLSSWWMYWIRWWTSVFIKVVLVSLGTLLVPNLSTRWYAVSLGSILRLETIRLPGKAGTFWPGLLCLSVP